MISRLLPLAVLEFASLPMLGWLAAAALPWLIHRLYRRQHRKTPWAAVELLMSAMQQRARRVQLQQWLLIAVRTAILVLVALAVAEPALRQWAVGAGGTAQLHRIIVVDQSYSMGCQHQGGSRWQRAVEHAREWIETSDGHALTLIGWSDRAENLMGRPTFDASIALSSLDDLRLTDASADLPSTLRAVLAAIDRAEAEMPQIAAHQVVFCTDLGRQTWSANESDRLQLEAVAERAEITLANVAEAQPNNIAITNLTIEPAVTLQQRETMISATVACWGQAPEAEVRVELLIEGRKVDEQTVRLRSNAEVTARFAHRFVDEGAQTVQAVVAENSDSLALDDERWLIVDARPKLRVACFGGRTQDSRDLARALAPSVRGAERDSAIEPELFSVARINELELSNYAAVLLCSVPELSSREAAALTEYVRQGGGLAIFPDQATTPESLHTLKQILPQQLDSIQTPDESRFDPQDYRHPIVSPFRGQAQAGLLGVSVSQYWRLLSSQESEAEIVLQFDTGDPALVVDRFGLGRVAMSALPASLAARTAKGTPWSSLALSPSFLPLVRELVTYLVGDRWLQQRNLLVGETAIFPWTVGAAVADVRVPAGVSQQLVPPGVEDRGQLVFRETDDSGVYRFNADGQEVARFAINLDGRDSDLSSIDPVSLPAGVTDHLVENASSSPMSTGDFSFVRSLLAGASLLLLLEIGLAWQLGRGWG